MTTTFLMMLKLIINDLIILLFNNIPDNITSNKNGNQSNFEKKKKMHGMNWHYQIPWVAVFLFKSYLQETNGLF